MSDLLPATADCDVYPLRRPLAISLHGFPTMWKLVTDNLAAEPADSLHVADFKMPLKRFKMESPDVYKYSFFIATILDPNLKDLK